MTALRFVHLTDPHIAAGDEAVQFGTNTVCTFRSVLADLRSLTASPDFVLLTGDLVSNGLAESYEVFRDTLKVLSSPVYLSLGNHDSRLAFRRVVLGDQHPSEQPYCYTFHAGGVTFFVLDSYLAGTSAGIVDRKQIEWLTAQLHACKGAIAVCIHHHVMPTGLAWLDRLILRNGQELMQLLGTHPEVRMVFFGHVHRTFQGRFGATALIGTPSTCYQFGPCSESREISDEPPAYRIVTLEDGQLTTEMRWVKQV